jgi:ABC-2 type transport system ATP-binding protein
VQGDKLFVIALENISKRYDNVVALNGISLTIPQGSVLGVLGPNGAGKTTLFKVVAGLLNADGGALRPISGRWPSMAYKPDRLIYPERMRVDGYLELFGRLADLSPAARQQGIKDALARTGLLPMAWKRIGALSRGMRQRLALAQALLGDPELLLLDEPGNGLDPGGQIEIQRLIRQLQEEGKTIILSSHQLEEVTAVCSDIVILNHGKIRYRNRVADALALRPQLTIRVGGEISRVLPHLRALHPAIVVQGDTILLEEPVWHLRRRILTLLLGAGNDILHLEHRRITLHEIYAEAVR